MTAPIDDAEAREGDPSDASDPSDIEDDAVPARRPRGVHDDGDDGSPRKRLLILVALVMAAAGVAAMVLVFIEGKGTYSKPVDELVAQKAGFVGKPVRADGVLVHGSLAKGDDGCHHVFTIAKNGAEIPVRFPQCVVPDSLRDVAGIDVEVSVEGVLNADSSIEATRVFTKCPSRYKETELAARGETAPHR